MTLENGLKPICFFNSNKSWGGGESWVYENCTRAHRAGLNVHVVVNETSALGDKLEAETDIRVYRHCVSNLSFLNPFTLSKFKSFFQHNSIDSVIFSLPSDIKAGGIAARLAGVRNVVYRRGIALPIRDTALNRFLFKHIITKFICNSRETLRLALRENSALIERERTVIIYNGFNLESYDSQDDALTYERAEGEIVLGNSGRLTAQKGQRMSLDALKQLLERGHNVRLLVAGTGELETDLKDYAASIGVAEQTEFLGFVESMKGFYSSIDMLVHTALWEGFGYVLVEAMATHKPVVAFNVSSNPEVIADGVTGLLAPSNDVAGLADRVEDLILHPEKRKKLGNNGRERVVAEFESERAFQRLLLCLNDS